MKIAETKKTTREDGLFIVMFVAFV